MNSTVAIALITSISTLAGASISAYITLSVSRAQGKNQAVLANAERIDQQSAAKRQIRRDAYVQFLNQFSKAEQALDMAWKTTPSTDVTVDAVPTSPVGVELDALQQAGYIVALESSVDVWAAALKLQIKLTKERADMVIAAMNSNGNPPCIQDNARYLALLKERGNLKNDFIFAAQEDLKDAFSTVLLSTTPETSQTPQDESRLPDPSLDGQVTN
jgi:hypothetical protein